VPVRVPRQVASSVMTGSNESNIANVREVGHNGGMSRTALREIELPDQMEATQAADAVVQLTAFLRSHPTPTTRVQLVSDTPDGTTTIVVPSVAFAFFVDVLTELANGNAVTVAPVSAELTTQQAADLLNVSRPFLLKLLDERTIPYRRVGNRRKLLLTDVLTYRSKNEALRREIADELTREAQALGLDY
jgi:excisionase family DNA binding protein